MQVRFEITTLQRKNNDLKNGVYETTEYLELFLKNLLLNEQNELHNRSMHISGILTNAQKADIRDGKTDIKSEKADIQSKLLNLFTDMEKESRNSMRYQRQTGIDRKCWSSGERHGQIW